ncbi:MAG: hypothetical protein ABH834_04010 [Candidatus Altiarchaeota archaeon]
MRDGRKPPGEKKVRGAVARAFPGLPVVFAEGYGESRRSLHSSASFAVTDVEGGVRTETSVSEASGDSFTVDGEPLTGLRGEGMHAIVSSMKNRAGYGGGVIVESVNRDVKSGSSDSGAAALVKALDGLFGLGLSDAELLGFARLGSETAYRSVLGGLSIYDVHSDSFKRIAEPEEFRDLRIFGVSFDLPRFKADDIHKAVVKHPEYPARRKEADGKIVDVSEALAEGDFLGVLEVMEFDAKRVHKMFREVGFDVIKPEMRRVCELTESLRKEGVPAYWNVAAGSIVYVFTIKDFEGDVHGTLSGRGYEPVRMRVAEGV